MKWGIFAGCINEAELIEAKIEWALNRDMNVSIVEGHHPNYTDVGENHLSIDGTTEILESYADRINYKPIGLVKHQAVLRDTAYKNLPEDTEICIMSDIDEFYTDEDLEYLDSLYKRRKNLKLTVTDSLIFLDDEYCSPHIRRKEGNPFLFNKNRYMWFGQFHERIFRYNKYYGYERSPFLINDIFKRFIFSDPVYIGDRILTEDVKMLHYKNFKMKEAKKRHEMYKERGDKEDYTQEWKILEENKFKYEGEHPKEVWSE